MTSVLDQLVSVLRAALPDPTRAEVECAYSLLAGAHVTLADGDGTLVGYDEAAAVCERAFGATDIGFAVIRAHDDPAVAPVCAALLDAGVRRLLLAPRPSWTLGADRACLHVCLFRPTADPAAPSRERERFIVADATSGRGDPLGDWAFG